MQINVCGIRYQKKNTTAEIAISQKLIVFTFSFAKRNSSKFFLSKVNLKTPQQCDLSESMAWQIIERLEVDKHRSIAESVGALWTPLQETGNVIHQPGKVVHVLPQHVYLVLTAHWNNATQLQSVYLLTTEQGVNPNSSKSKLNISQLFLWPLQLSMQPEEDGLLNIELGCNLNGVKCFLLMSHDSVWSVTPNVFWYERKEALKITLCSYRKDHSTDEANW